MEQDKPNRKAGMTISLIDSQNDILPYNSLKQNDLYNYGTATLEESKRLSKDEDLGKVSQHTLDHLEEDDYEYEEDSRQNDQKIYFEPIKQGHLSRSNQKLDSKDTRDGEGYKISINNGSKYSSSQNTNKGKDQEKQTKVKNHSSRKQNYTSANTFVEHSQSFGMNHPADNNQRNVVMNDSMSSNQSSLNKSLKLKERQQRKKTRNPLGIPVTQPQAFGQMRNAQTFSYQ